jgi:lipopolysaccharide biosynthesis protein
LNPRPGFSDNLYKSQHGLDLDGEFVALDQAILDGSPIPPSTHVCTIYDGRSNGASPGDRIALHLHLFYPDLARDFLNRLEKLDRRMDLFITTHGVKKVHQLEYEFADYALGTVSVVDCPNKGRDIGPFMTALRSPLAGGGYDLIGHLHGKKSLAVEDRVPGLGARWREYALDALLGTASDFHTLLGRFGLNPKLGLVFAEDRNAVGWAGNRSIAEALAARLPSAVNLPAAPFYPLGNMFWARPAALSLLWNLNLGWDDYPPEPLPYDGTVLHTVERMLPSLVEAAGYDWETVYKPGASW